MTIELVTGTPGAGKTCYAVAKRIIGESGKTVAVESPTGSVDMVERRIIVAGIRDLAVPHERLPHTLTGERVSVTEIETWNAVDKDGEPDFKRLPGDPAHLVPASLFNWWLWCRPGDLIVCDEVQFIIPRGTLGKTPPHYIKSLEIHRHYGVDFLFITQSPQLLDATIRNLVGLHRHIRSVMGSPLCLVYEWDHASNTERITNASKRFYRRKAAYFKLYKSTVAVVKPPSSGRMIFWALPLLLAAFLAFGSHLKSKFSPPAPSAPFSALSDQALPAGSVSRYASTNPQGWRDVPKLGGCYAVGDDCRCMEPDGRPVRLAASMCKTSASSFDGLVRWEPRPPLPASAPGYGAAASQAPRTGILPSSSSSAS